MKRFFHSRLFFVLFCFAVALVLILGAAGSSSARSHPKAYKGSHKQKIEFVKRHDRCVAEQNRIQSRYKNRQ